MVTRRSPSPIRTTVVALTVAVSLTGCGTSGGSGGGSGAGTTSPPQEPTPTTASVSLLERLSGDRARVTAGVVIPPATVSIPGVGDPSGPGVFDTFADAGVTGGGPTDAGADTFEEIGDLAATDVEAFWSKHWETQYPTIFYEGPTSFSWYDSARGVNPENECTEGVQNVAIWSQNAFYCTLDGTISYDVVLAASEYQQSGDFAIVGTVAHEWAHHLQALLRSQVGAADQPTFTIESELQADCFAGVYARGAGASGTFPVNESDLMEAAEGFYLSGTDAEHGWFEPGFHGTRQERLDAFAYGYQNGEARACDSYATYMMDRSIIRGPYAFGHLPEASVNLPDADTFEVRGAGFHNLLQGRAYELGQVEQTDAAVLAAFAEVLSAWAPGGATSEGTALVAVREPEDLSETTQANGVPGGTIGYAYEQDLNGSPVHGIVVVNLQLSGSALILDVSADGPAPTSDSGWETLVEDAKLALMSFQAPGVA